MGDGSMTASIRTFDMIRNGNKVAEGSIFSDGVTVVHWVTPDLPRSTVVWDSMGDALTVHDHDGNTTIEWTHV
jgi:hypothetical protein